MQALNKQAGGDHYKSLKIQPVEYCIANGLDAIQSNIIKYATRHKAKGGAGDLRKVIHYAELGLQLQYGEGMGDEPEEATPAPDVAEYVCITDHTGSIHIMPLTWEGRLALRDRLNESLARQAA